MSRTEEGWMVKVWRFIKRERLWIFRILGAVSAPLYAACIWSISVTFLGTIAVALSEFDWIVADFQLGIGLMMGSALLAFIEMVRYFCRSMMFAKRVAEMPEAEFTEKVVFHSIALIAAIVAFVILAAIVVFIAVMITRAFS